MTPIAPLIETFLRDTLACQRGASRHTRDSYASSFQLLSAANTNSVTSASSAA